MYNKVLVPLDGSHRAEAIMPHVEELARRYGAAVVLMQVVEPMVSMPGPYGAVPDYQTYADSLKHQMTEAKNYLAGWQGILNAKGVAAHSVVENGPIVRCIVEVADRENIDVIAMSSHGRTGLSRAFYGSVAAGLLHQTDRPLLLIRSKTGD